MWKKQSQYNDSKSDRYSANSRVLRNKFDQSKALTYRETPDKPLIRKGDDLFDRDSDRRYGSVTKFSPKRNRIFQALPRRVEHFEIGAHMYNLNFQQIDVSILPRFFYSRSCGCESSLEPCGRITKLLTKEKLFRMQLQYQQIKEEGKDHMPFLVIQELMTSFPEDYPSAFKSIIENLLQVTACDEITFPLLYSIAWHCKSQFISYFVYTELVKLTYTKEEFVQQMNKQISMFSKDLATLLEKVNQKDLSIFYEMFCESGGTNLIPIQQYGKYIEHLNKQGHHFPARVLFTALLDSKNFLPSYVYDMGSNIPHLAQKLKSTLPWGRIFDAATHRFIKR